MYPYFTAYVKDNKVVTWKQSKWVLKDAPKKAIEAYNKAYELDPKTAEKVKEGLKQVSDFCSQVGNVGIDSGNYVEAADAYVTAFEAQSSPALLCGLPADRRRLEQPQVVRQGRRVPDQGHRPGLCRRGG